MSEARKFKLYLTIAEQSTEQQENASLTQTILANARTLVLFGTGSSVDEQLLLPRLAPHVEQGELLNLPIYNFYLKTAVEIPMEPTSGKTIRLEDHYTLSDERAEEVIAASRKNYARKYEEPKTETVTKKQGKKKSTKEMTKEKTVKQSEAKDTPASKFKGRSIGNS